jgi:hypothetical protein
MMLLEILDDDARLGHGAVRGLVVQHRDLPHRPELAEFRLRLGVPEIDEDALERGLVLVEGDQRLLAERRERMEMERERHA